MLFFGNSNERTLASILNEDFGRKIYFDHFFVRSKLGHFTHFPHNVVTLFFLDCHQNLLSPWRKEKSVVFIAICFHEILSRAILSWFFAFNFFLPSFLFSKISIMSALIMQTSNDSFRINHGTGLKHDDDFAYFALKMGKHDQLVMTTYFLMS